MTPTIGTGATMNLSLLGFHLLSLEATPNG